MDKEIEKDGRRERDRATKGGEGENCLEQPVWGNFYFSHLKVDKRASGFS